MLRKGIIIILLLTNLLTIGVLIYDEKNEDHNSFIDMYMLNGESKNWEINNYKIIITSKEVQRGYAEIIYKGNPSDISYSTYYGVNFYEHNPKDNQYQVVLAKEATSLGGSVNILENIKKVGHIIGSYTYDETLKTKDDYNKTYVIIKWEDSNGKGHEETVYLSTEDYITIDNL